MTYLADGELVCEGCYRGSDEDRDDDRVIGGETDSPRHCSYCHRPLDGEFGLTYDGVRNVLETIKSHLQSGISRPEWRWEYGWYKGLGSDAVLLDWIELWIEPIKYTLDKRDQRLVDLFVQWRGPRELEIARKAENQVLTNTIIGH